MTFWPVFTKFIQGHAHPRSHGQDEADQDNTTWHWQEKKLKGDHFDDEKPPRAAGHFGWKKSHLFRDRPRLGKYHVKSL
jgi:hypothetical protein